MSIVPEIITMGDMCQRSSWLELYDVYSCKELFKVLQKIDKKYKPFDDEGALSSMKTLYHLIHFDSYGCGKKHPIVKYILLKYWCYTKFENLNKHLRQNPPRVTFQNPDVWMGYTDWEFTKNEFVQNLMDYVAVEIDLPGSKFNPIGQGYYSDLFIHMFFGNYSDFIQHIEKLSEQELKRTLAAREGYPQFSPVFAPVIGRRMIYIEQLPWLTKHNVSDIRTVWNGKNENQHFKILRKLLQLGADVNAYDITGNTALDYASLYPDCDKVVPILLKYGADPNRRAFKSTLCLYVERFRDYTADRCWSILDLLLDSNAKPINYKEGLTIRTILEEKYSSSMDFVAKARELLGPKENNTCERTDCMESAVKKCSGCSFVVYCTPACQKLDWKFHKPTCKKKKEEKELEMKKRKDMEFETMLRIENMKHFNFLASGAKGRLISTRRPGGDGFDTQFIPRDN